MDCGAATLVAKTRKLAVAAAAAIVATVVDTATTDAAIRFIR